MANTKKALLVVDVQNDFCPGGSLAVANGDRVVAPLNRAVAAFRNAGLPVLATRDWHPSETIHFKSGGGPWPPHCVRGTHGSEFHPDLDLAGATVLSKGSRSDEDAYSGFQARDDQDRTLEAILREAGVAELVVGGLATDYCVLSTVLDARRLGFPVTVVDEAIMAVDVQPGDGERARQKMLAEGARIEPLEKALSGI